MHKETRICPPEFQNRLRVFGRNPYGENLYKFSWGRTSFIKMGNVWRDRYGNERREYRPRCQNHEMQCWTLMRWKPPSFYGSPESYYRQTWDATSRLYNTGEYPWQGRYEPVQPFMEKKFGPKKPSLECVQAHRMVDGKEVIEDITIKVMLPGEMIVEHLELNHFLIDAIVPMIEALQRLSVEEQKAAREFEEAERARREAEENAECFKENLPVWINPVSFSNQGCRTSLLDRKMEQIQKQLNRLTVRGRAPQFAKGFAVGDRPRVN